MRLLLLTSLGLAALAACKPAPEPSPDTQTAPVAIELLVLAAGECDHLEQDIKSAWYQVSNQTTIQGDLPTVARQVLAANSARGIEIAILEAEAERRVAELTGRKDLMAELVSNLNTTTRYHCAMVAYPRARDENAYNRETRRAETDRVQALSAVLKVAPPRDSRGDQEIRLIAQRIQAAQAPAPDAPSAPAPPRPTQERRASAEAPRSDADRDRTFVASDRAVLVQSWGCRRGRDSIRIEGEVRNASSTTLEDGFAVVTFVDYSGNEMGTHKIALQTPRLAPADTSRFSLVVTDKRRDLYRAKITFEDAQGRRIETLGEAKLEQDIRG